MGPVPAADDAFRALAELTVVHDGFDPGSRMAGMVSQGWPRVLSDLKTFLEVGPDT